MTLLEKLRMTSLGLRMEGHRTRAAMVDEAADEIERLQELYSGSVQLDAQRYRKLRDLAVYLGPNKKGTSHSWGVRTFSAPTDNFDEAVDAI